MACNHYTAKSFPVTLFTILILFLYSQPAVTALDFPVPIHPIPDRAQPILQPNYPMWAGGSFMDSAASTGAYRLHAIGITGKGVTAAVLDTPFDPYHPAIAANVIGEASAAFSFDNGVDVFRYINNMDWIAGNGSGYDVFMKTGLHAVSIYAFDNLSDTSTHGTHVAGTIVGMAPDAGLVLTHSSHWTHPVISNNDTIIEFGATDFALSYVADIASTYNIVAINNSWGSKAYYSRAEADVLNPSRSEALRQLVAAGVVPVFASGNEGVNNFVRYPTSMTNVLGVGALHPNGYITDFSNQSDEVVLLAPGENIFASIPLGRYEAQSGTSMAAPHVTGAIALLASGARAASPREIISALSDSGDPVVFDGSILIPPGESSLGNNADVDSIIRYLAANSMMDHIDVFQENSLDDWRECVLIIDQWGSAARNLGLDMFNPANFPQIISEYQFQKQNNPDSYPNSESLDHTEYRFLRVDKAFMLLTARRTILQAADVLPYTRIGAGMLSAYAGELYADINMDTADIFQRLDAQSAATLATISRQMSPEFAGATVDYAQMGVAGMLRSLGRRGNMARLEKSILSTALPLQSAQALASYNPEYNAKATFWLEGFGSFGKQSGDNTTHGYDGRLAGAVLGFEGYKGDLTYGIFGSWSDLRVDGDLDGRTDGNWYNAGLYARLDRPRFFIEAAATYSYGDYDTNRQVFIPGAAFRSNLPGTFIVYDPIYRNASASISAHGVSGRLAGGVDVLKGDGWAFGPRAEGTLSYVHVPGYAEDGAGSLNLTMDSYGSVYAEGGAGLGASKAFLEKGGIRRLVAQASVIGLYGASSGDNLDGRFSQYGTRFSLDPERTSAFSCVPEASLTWRITDQVDLSASYAGRFRSGYSENSGTLRFGISW